MSINSCKCVKKRQHFHDFRYCYNYRQHDEKKLDGWNLGDFRENLIFCQYLLHLSFYLKILSHICDTNNRDYLPHITFLFYLVDFQLNTDFPYQFYVFTAKSLCVTQRSVSKENAFKKSKNSSPFLLKTIGLNNYFTSNWKQFQGFFLDREVWIQGNNTLWPIGKKHPVVTIIWRNSTNTWFWRMQRIFLSFLDIFDLLNPNPNDASVYMLSVLRFGWKYTFLIKKTFLACFEVFTLFSLLMGIDNNFTITFNNYNFWWFNYILIIVCVS